LGFLYLVYMGHLYGFVIRDVRFFKPAVNFSINSWRR
jgi:hypothetical protein